MDGFLNDQRLLVIAPHADDEVIGCGGLIAKTKEAGGEVFVMVMTVGDLDHYDGREGKTKGSTRAAELSNAMEYLSVDDWEIVMESNEWHLRLDGMPRRDLVTIFEREARLSIDRIKPTMLAIPAPSFNQDHVAVYDAALTACRPHLASMKPFQRCVLVADSPQLAWNYRTFKPTLYFDISELLDKKLEAYKMHESQQRPPEHMGSVESLRLLAEWRGREISVAAAEAYEVARFVI